MSAEAERWREVRTTWPVTQPVREAGDALAAALEARDRRIAELEARLRRMDNAIDPRCDCPDCMGGEG